MLDKKKTSPSNGNAAAANAAGNSLCSTGSSLHSNSSPQPISSLENNTKQEPISSALSSQSGPGSNSSSSQSNPSHNSSNVSSASSGSTGTTSTTTTSSSSGGTVPSDKMSPSLSSTINSNSNQEAYSVKSEELSNSQCSVSESESGLDTKPIPVSNNNNDALNQFGSGDIKLNCALNGPSNTPNGPPSISSNVSVPSNSSNRSINTPGNSMPNCNIPPHPMSSQCSDILSDAKGDDMLSFSSSSSVPNSSSSFSQNISQMNPMGPEMPNPDMQPNTNFMAQNNNTRGMNQSNNLPAGAQQINSAPGGVGNNIGSGSKSSLSLDSQYMQQSSQIFVFSTQLANKAAEAVATRTHVDIIHYHCTQPGTLKVLEKNPLKVTQFNKPNQAQWLSTFAHRASGPLPGQGPMGPMPGPGCPPPMRGSIRGGPIGPPMGPMTRFGHRCVGPCNGPCGMHMPPGGPPPGSWPGGPGPGLGPDGGWQNQPCFGPPGPRMPPQRGCGPNSAMNPMNNQMGMPPQNQPFNSKSSDHLLPGTAVPDDNLTPQQRKEREEKLAKLRNMCQQFCPELMENQDSNCSSLGHPNSNMRDGAASDDSYNASRGSLNDQGFNSSSPVNGMPSNQMGRNFSKMGSGPGMTPTSNSGPMWPEEKRRRTNQNSSVPTTLNSQISSPHPSPCPPPGMNSPHPSPQMGHRVPGPPPPYHQGPRPNSSPHPASPRITSPAEVSRSGYPSNHRMVPLQSPGPSTPGDNSNSMSNNLNSPKPQPNSGSGSNGPSRKAARNPSASPSPSMNRNMNNQDSTNSANNSIGELKDATLIPVPSPQQIQYLNHFDGQELTIQKQPNTSLREMDLISPPADLDLGFAGELAGPPPDLKMNPSMEHPHNPRFPSGYGPGDTNPPRFPGQQMDPRMPFPPNPDMHGPPFGPGPPSDPNMRFSGNDNMMGPGMGPRMRLPNQDMQRYPGPGMHAPQYMQGPGMQGPNTQMGHMNQMFNDSGMNHGGNPGGPFPPNSRDMRDTVSSTHLAKLQTMNPPFDLGPPSKMDSMPDMLSGPGGGPGPGPGLPSMNRMMPFDGPMGDQMGGPMNPNMGPGGMPPNCPQPPQFQNSMPMPGVQQGHDGGQYMSQQQMSQQMPQGPQSVNNSYVNANHPMNQMNVPGQNFGPNQNLPPGGSSNPGIQSPNHLERMPGPQGPGPVHSPSPMQMMNCPPKMPPNGPRVGPNTGPGFGPRMNFSGPPNIQVKASTPNTIQYLPARPVGPPPPGQNMPMNPRPNLEFLQRYAPPISNLDSKLPTHNLQYFPGNGPAGGPVMGPSNPGPGPMPPNNHGGPLPGNPHHMSGPMGPGHGPGMRPPHMMGPDGYNNNPMGMSGQMQGPPPFGKPGMDGPGMGPGMGPDTSQPLPPSVGGNHGSFNYNKYNANPMGGDQSASDPNYALQFQHFQQQLYATNSRSGPGSGPGPGPPSGPGMSQNPSNGLHGIPN